MILATARKAWAVDEDAAPLVSALQVLGVRAEPGVWDDPSTRWQDAALVVVRSTWDYATRRNEFLEWAARVSAIAALANPVEVLRWNTDKTYLGDLAGCGLPVVPTHLVEPSAGPDRLPCVLEAVSSGFADRGFGELVVKPTVSAGSKDTGRFALGADPGAVHLLDRILATDRSAMVQPYLSSVDSLGETGLVFFDGVFSHGFRKGALLSPDTEAAHGLFAMETIAPRTPSAREIEVAEAVLAEVDRRFGHLLYARVDLLADEHGDPVLLELELTEPSWFLQTDPGAAGRAAEAIAARVGCAA